MWVFGPTAVGKKTFIMNTALRKDDRLINLLGLYDTVIIPFIPIRYLNDTKKRYKQIKDIYKIINDDDNMAKKFANHLYLIHAQGIDFREGFIDDIYQKYPDLFNRCIMINISEEKYNNYVITRNVHNLKSGKRPPIKDDHKTAYLKYNEAFLNKIEYLFKGIIRIE